MKPGLKFAIAALTAVVCLSSAYFFVDRTPFEALKPAVGEAAPEIALSDLSGKMLRLSDYTGKVVLVNFWATWCPPCKDEMPGFQRMLDTYGDRGFEVVAIAIDDVGPSAAKELRVTFPLARINDRVNKAYGAISHVPVSFLIGRDGRIVKKVKSYYAEEALKEDLEKALGPEK